MLKLKIKESNGIVRYQYLNCVRLLSEADGLTLDSFYETGGLTLDSITENQNECVDVVVEREYISFNDFSFIDLEEVKEYDKTYNLLFGEIRNEEFDSEYANMTTEDLRAEASRLEPIVDEKIKEAKKICDRWVYLYRKSHTMGAEFE